MDVQAVRLSLLQAITQTMQQTHTIEHHSYAFAGNASSHWSGLLQVQMGFLLVQIMASIYAQERTAAGKHRDAWKHCTDASKSRKRSRCIMEDMMEGKESLAAAIAFLQRDDEGRYAHWVQYKSLSGLQYPLQRCNKGCWCTRIGLLLMFSGLHEMLRIYRQSDSLCCRHSRAKVQRKKGKGSNAMKWMDAIASTKTRVRSEKGGKGLENSEKSKVRCHPHLKGLEIWGGEALPVPKFPFKVI